MDFNAQYDAIYALVTEAFPQHKELNDPLFIEDNSSKLLQQGWGIRIAEGEPTNRTSDCKFSLRQNVIITLTRLCAWRDEDTAGRRLAEKQMLSDAITLIGAVETSPQPGGDIELLSFVSHNGIERIFSSDEKAFLMIQATFSIEAFKPRGT